MKLLHQTKTGGGLLVALGALLLAGCDAGTIVSSHTQSDSPLTATSATRTEQGKWQAFEVLQTNQGPPPPFETRFRGSTRHDLDVRVRGLLDGDIVGTFTATINAHLHLHPEKEGIYAGPARLDGTWSVRELFGNPVIGTLEVKGHGYRELPGPFTGRLTAMGTGDLEGIKLQATFGNGPAPGTFVIKGQILDPR